MEFITRYLIALGTFLVLDSVWLTLAAPRIYRKYLGDLLAKKPDFVAAGLFYALFAIGLVVFVINPALTSGKWLEALWRGALFGLIAYATYDLTNQATLANWSKTITTIDLLWGTFITAVVSLVSYGLLTLLD